MPYKERLTTIGIPESTKIELESYKQLNESPSWNSFFKEVMKFLDENGEAS